MEMIWDDRLSIHCVYLLGSADSGGGTKQNAWLCSLMSRDDAQIWGLGQHNRFSEFDAQKKHTNRCLCRRFVGQLAQVYTELRKTTRKNSRQLIVELGR
jgi:hypothetical protein